MNARFRSNPEAFVQPDFLSALSGFPGVFAVKDFDR
jgi:hypothetical protein